VEGVERDDFGAPIPAAMRARRIVSLNPATTELLFAIGAGPRLVGRSRWDVWPRAALAVPSVGDGLHPDVERVLAARPDLVVLYASAENRVAATRFRAAGIATLALRIDRPAQLDRAAMLLGRVTGDSAQAALVADTVSATLRRVRAQTAALPHPTVVWVLVQRPPMVVGGGSFLNDLLETAGARNLYASLPQPSPVVTLEDIVRRNPALVITGTDAGNATAAVHALQTDPAWRAVAAVRAGRIVAPDGDLVERPSVNIGQAAVALARLLHPGVPIR